MSFDAISFKSGVEFEVDNVEESRLSGDVRRYEISYREQGGRKTCRVLVVRGHNEGLLENLGLSSVSTQPYVVTLIGDLGPNNTDAKTQFKGIVKKFRADILACAKDPESPHYKHAVEILAIIAERAPSQDELVAREASKKAEREMKALEKQTRSLAIKAQVLADKKAATAAPAAASAAPTDLALVSAPAAPAAAPTDLALVSAPAAAPEAAAPADTDADVTPMELGI